MDRLKLPEDQPLEAKMVSKSIERAQRQVESQNFEIRKNVLKYDEVMNRQREVIYEWREAILEGTAGENLVVDWVDDVLGGLVESHFGGGIPKTQWDWDAFQLELAQYYVSATQALCDVCAVVETDVRALATRLVPVPAIVTCSANSLDGVFDDVVRVGSALGVTHAASAFVREARARLLTVHETLKAARAPRPRVAVIEWGAPVYAAGHWMPEMVRRAGGVDVLATAGAHSVRVAAGDVERADPEVIVIAPCGYDLSRSVAEATSLLARAEWRWASERRVVAIDANAYASRPGPRLVDGVEILARLFHEPLFTPLDPRSAQVLTA
jgi:iron complex transport system substrate-binding protein